MRNRLTLVCTVWMACLVAPTSALAGLYADELSKCLVASTTAEDRNGLVKWMFAAMSQHPEVRSMSKLTPEQGEQLLADTARLLERLLTVSCHAQAKAAVEYEGPNTLQISFQVLGEVAGRGLFAQPEVAAFAAKLETHVDQKKVNQSLGIE